MANDLTANPWVVDTASATAITADKIRVDKFRWIGGTTAGHTCIVKNSAGKTVWSSIAAGANFIDDSSNASAHLFDCKGIAVTTLASGILYIYFK